MPGAENGGEVVAINLLPVREGRTREEFERFSAEVDQPTCLAQDVVLGFDAYAVTHRDPGAPEVDVVEVMTVRSWDRWVDVRDNSEAMRPVVEGFTPLVGPAAVRTVFGQRIRPAR